MFTYREYIFDLGSSNPNEVAHDNRNKIISSDATLITKEIHKPVRCISISLFKNKLLVSSLAQVSLNDSSTSKFFAS